MKVCFNYSKTWKSLLSVWVAFNIFTILMLGWNFSHASVTGNDLEGTAKECFTDLFTQKQICWKGDQYFYIPLLLDIIAGVITYSWVWWHYNSKNQWIVLSWCEQKKGEKTIID